MFSQRRERANRFWAGVTAGANASQINGDHLSGYNKFGYFAGLRLATRFKKQDLIIEMQYVRKGSRDPDQFVPSNQSTRFLSLEYIEVPILYHRKIHTNSGVLGIEGGVSFSRLFNIDINENRNSVNYRSFYDIEKEFRNVELSFLIGGGVDITKHLRVVGRFSIGLTRLYENENPIPNRPGELLYINELRNLQLSLGLNYNL